MRLNVVGFYWFYMVVFMSSFRRDWDLGIVHLIDCHVTSLHIMHPAASVQIQSGFTLLIADINNHNYRPKGAEIYPNVPSWRVSF